VASQGQATRARRPTTRIDDRRGERDLTEANSQEVPADCAILAEKACYKAPEDARKNVDGVDRIERRDSQSVTRAELLAIVDQSIDNIRARFQLENRLVNSGIPRSASHSSAHLRLLKVMASSNMASVDFSPEQLATLSTDEIESLLHRDQVNLAHSSKQNKFQNWAKTFSCDPERGTSDRLSYRTKIGSTMSSP
jgi:hypothetical protein